MKKIFQVVFVLCLLAISSFASANGYIEAEGIIYYEKGMKPNQMRRMAVLEAYRTLAEEVDSIHVTSNTTVRNLCDLDDEINSHVEAVLRGAKVISVTQQKDGSFRAKVRLSMYGSENSLASVVLEKNVLIEDFPKPKFTSVRTEVKYTGLVIDCRGLNLSTAITPAIKTVGGIEIYAYKNVGYENAVIRGIVEYADVIDSPRAGTSPLVVKAVEISRSCDVVISDEDADRILAVNQSTNILTNCAVVLVR
ncbi:MAG: LPP20 family lipoprotein [Selenomonadaceae bacterium]|nr:LPP20 family lipoprotein [Selenomonadaceae bacterium]